MYVWGGGGGGGELNPANHRCKQGRRERERESIEITQLFTQVVPTRVVVV